MSAPGQPDRDDPHDALGSVFLASTENAIVGPSLPFELLIYIYEFLLTPDARLTQKAQLSFRAVCRHWRKAAYRSDLFVRGSKVFRLLEYLEQEPETQRTDVVSLRMKFGYTDPSFQVDTLRRLLNSLPRLRELCLAGTKINTGHLSRIAAAPCGAGLVSLRLDLNGGPAGVFFDYEASFPSLEEFGLEGPFGSYVTNYPFPPPQLSSLFLPTWSDGGEELKPLLVAASARNASLKKLVLPFDAWCDLTDPSVVDEYLSNALDGLRKLSLVRSGQTWGLLSADEERAQVNDTHLHPRFWPKELRTLDLTSMQFQKETSLLKFILESISDTRRAAREPHLQQQQHERSLDLILAANVQKRRGWSKFVPSTKALTWLIGAQHDQHSPGSNTIATLDALDRIIFITKPNAPSFDTVQQAEAQIAPLVRLARDKGQDRLRWYFEDKFGDRHRIRAL